MSVGSVPVGVERHLNVAATKLRGRIFRYGAFSPLPSPAISVTSPAIAKIELLAGIRMSRQLSDVRFPLLRRNDRAA